MAQVRNRAPVATLVVLSLALLGLLGGCAGAAGAVPTTPMLGTQLKGKVSPEFALLDGQGREVRLSDLRGRPVVLTFQYTYCPDTLPVVTDKFVELTQRLGERAGAVSFLAVSIDPERDTPERAGRFVSERQLEGVMSFLTGERATLEAVWKNYAIGVTRLPIQAGSPDSRRYGAYAIGHSDALYILDKAGRQRAFMRSTFAVEDLLSNLEVLLLE